MDPFVSLNSLEHYGIGYCVLCCRPFIDTLELDSNQESDLNIGTDTKKRNAWAVRCAAPAHVSTSAGERVIGQLESLVLFPVCNLHKPAKKRLRTSHQWMGVGRRGSPATGHPSRRENEFKKPAHAPQNGRIYHRPNIYNKNEGLNTSGVPVHRPPPLRIPNGIQTQSGISNTNYEWVKPSHIGLIPLIHAKFENAIDSQPPIESILKEMKSLPTPLSVIAATPRKEQENKFIFNPYTNKQ
ncbi:hypothetical protein KGM_213315 [Danaus plexippus plexippus]|uniref:Uncharacterized protein n=1 Tax=Danaus plexippus plexippus TaxID=278856 RepID=A0A212EM80_DANPL|nr:hypothetical protein KGM_213315 [Danaus plexippus plexippus]